MTEYYVLNEAGEAVPTGSLYEWSKWFETNRDGRMVSKTTVGEAEVSTVFLGMNHQWGSGPPLIFETMIFGGKWESHCWRWSTRAQSVAAHDQIVAVLRDGKSPEDAVPA
jgi:hypothetical protein